MVWRGRGVEWAAAGWDERKQLEHERFWLERIRTNANLKMPFKVWHFLKIFVWKVPEAHMLPDELLLLRGWLNAVYGSPFKHSYFV